MKYKFTKKLSIEKIILFILVAISLTIGIIDGVRSEVIADGNVTKEVFSIFQVESIALALTLWSGLIIILSLVYLLIAKKIRDKHQNKPNREDSDMVFSQGNEERNVTACDYRKWSK